MPSQPLTEVATRDGVAQAMARRICPKILRAGHTPSLCQFNRAQRPHASASYVTMSPGFAAETTIRQAPGSVRDCRLPVSGQPGCASIAW